ncbi:hypothetical protein OIO90_000276 [Microbotryomycetes sp. JL221]|nr:hypothetical protein OIO90_000276 [Microbotryomycetes sp. JL221]
MLLDVYDQFRGPTLISARIPPPPAGRGLVVKGTIPLISCPPSSLLNVKTLSPFYPASFSKALNSSQWVSLHIALQYARNRKSFNHLKNPRDHFQPFIASIPDEFPTLPLYWSLAARTRDQLCMPPAVKTKSKAVEARFKKDWQRTKQIWAEHRANDKTEDEELCFFDFALAWMNVNTRCVYFDLGLAKADNFTLAPIIDMTKPLKTLNNNLIFSSPDAHSHDPPLKHGDELSFSYGFHEDSMLLTEYGFTLGSSNPYNNLDVTSIVEQLFDEQGPEGHLKKGILQDQGYWGEMTMQGDGDEASASWRVLVALRLLHLRLSEAASKAASLTASVLAPWYAVLSGEIDVVSDSNEQRVTASLRTICQVVKLQVQEGLPSCEKLIKRLQSEHERKSNASSLGLLQSAAMLRDVCKTPHERAEESQLQLALKLSAAAAARDSGSRCSAVPPTAYNSLHGTLPTSLDSDNPLKHPQDPAALAVEPVTTNSSRNDGAISNNNTADSRLQASSRSLEDHQQLNTTFLIPNTLSLSRETLTQSDQQRGNSDKFRGTQSTGLTLESIESFESSLRGHVIHLHKRDQASTDLSIIEDGDLTMEQAEAPPPDEVTVVDSEDDRSGSTNLLLDLLDGPVRDCFSPDPVLAQAKTSAATEMHNKTGDRSPSKPEASASRLQTDTIIRKPSIPITITIPSIRKPPLPDLQRTKSLAPSKANTNDPDNEDPLSLKANNKVRKRFTMNSDDTDYDAPPHEKSRTATSRQRSVSSSGGASTKISKHKAITGEEEGSGLASTATTTSKPPVSTESADVEASLHKLSPQDDQSSSQMSGNKSTHHSISSRQTSAQKGKRGKTSAKAASSASGRGRKRVKKVSHTTLDSEEAGLDPQAVMDVDESGTEGAAHDSEVTSDAVPELPKSSQRKSSRKNKGIKRVRSTEIVDIPCSRGRSRQSLAQEEAISPVVKTSKRASGKNRKYQAVIHDDEAEVVLPSSSAGTVPQDPPAETESAPAKQSAGLQSKQQRATILDEADAGLADESSSEDEEDTNRTKENINPSPVRAGSSKGPASKTVQPRDPGSIGSREGTPAATGGKRSSLANVLARTGCYGVRQSGLSQRARVPRLHTNLKPPPPPKPALPKEKVRKKKGDESYSDEDKKWYKIKPVEEWDSDDHVKWQRHVRRQEMGLGSDDSD